MATIEVLEAEMFQPSRSICQSRVRCVRFDVEVDLGFALLGGGVPERSAVLVSAACGQHTEVLRQQDVMPPPVGGVQQRPRPTIRRARRRCDSRSGRRS